MRPRIPLFLLLLVVSSVSAFSQDSLPALIRQVKPSVVAIVTYDANGEPLISGSGFFLRQNQVVTNLHVIEGAHRAGIHTLEGKGKKYEVTGILAADAEADLALLSVSLPGDRSRPLPLSEAQPEEGEHVFVIGNPLRLEGSISDGIVSAVREVPGLGRVIQTTAPISHGNSGSPLLNMKGQVIGVVTIKVTNGQNINLALGASRLAKLEAKTPMTFEQLAQENRKGAQSEVLAEWWYRNGLNSLWLGNYDSALSYFQNAVQKNPRRAEAWIQVGFCKVKQGKNSDAIKAYQRALQLRPDSAEAYNKLGDAYYFSEQFNEAITAYREAVRLDPSSAEGYYNLGMTYLEIGDRVAAIAQAQILEPLDSELYKKLLGEIQR